MSGAAVEQPLYGPYGGLSEELAGAAKASNVNAVWFHMFQEEQFERCDRYGLAPCVELKTFRADFSKRPELIPIGIDGRPMRYGSLVQGVCLSHPDFIEEIEESLSTGLRRFAPAGVWLDYLTYSGWFETAEPDLQESCFCRSCVQEFCSATGLDADSPAEILARHRSAWTGHKCVRIAAYGARFASLVREARPGCVVGAYMCPWRPDEYDGALGRIFAQDYALLAPSIDVFTPLIYAAKSGRGAGWAAELLEASPGFLPAGRRMQLILDYLDYPSSMLAMLSSAVPSHGMQIYGGSRIFSDPVAARELGEAVSRSREDVRTSEAHRES